MGRTVPVEVFDPDDADKISYFRSMQAASHAFGWQIKDIKKAVQSGLRVKGTNKFVRVVPWKRLLNDRQFYNLQYSIPWNYKCGLDKIAAENGWTLTYLFRHCIVSTFSEETIWQKAQESGLAEGVEFVPLPAQMRRPVLVKPRYQYARLIDHDRVEREEKKKRQNARKKKSLSGKKLLTDNVAEAKLKPRTGVEKRRKAARERKAIWRANTGNR